MEEPQPIIPLNGRYASEAMKNLFPYKPGEDFRNLCSWDMRYLFSEEAKYLGWRSNWVILPECQMKLELKDDEGNLRITPEHIEALRKAEKNLNIARALELERKYRHDVNGHLYHFAEEADKILPKAGGILHLGATSCYNTDNEEISAINEALVLVRDKVAILKEQLIDAVPSRADEYTANFDLALEEMDYRVKSLKARGAKGTTGTQASYLILFDGDHEKVKSLDQMVSEAMGFKESYTITGQTYPRIVDYQALSSLGLVAEVLKELVTHKEGYVKYNWLLEHVQRCADIATHIAANQWMERTIDDSSGRRIIIPEAFYAIDYVLEGLLNETKPEKQKFSAIESGGLENHVFRKNSDPEIGLALVLNDMANAIDKLHTFAVRYKDAVCTGYTHYQPAQPMTWGKRIDLWAYNFVLALKDGEMALGVKIANPEKVSSRVRNYFLNSRLNQPAIAASKMAVDIRLGQNLMEDNEPFSITQKGSSAMPHKKNPIGNERINSLARVKFGLYDLNHQLDYAFKNTAAVMRDVLGTLIKDTPEKKGFTVHIGTAERNLEKYMPYFLGEYFMMMAAKKSEEGDRQKLHTIIRDCAIEARANEDAGKENNMLELLAATGEFDINLSKKEELLDPLLHIGRSREQVDEFGENEVEPIRKKYADVLGLKVDVKL